MNPTPLILALALLFFAACGSLDRTEKNACTSPNDCVEGSCVAGQCQPLQLTTNNTNSDTNQPNPLDEQPGARDAILESIGTTCEADSECADGLHCIDGGCVCCEFIIENPNGDGFICQDEVTPSQVGECVPRVGHTEADEFLDLGVSCGSRTQCAGDLLCAADGKCTAGGTFQGCNGPLEYDSVCMCCVRIASSEDELFPGAFECSEDPQFYRDNCAG